MKYLSKVKNEKGNTLFSVLIVATCVLMIVSLIFIDTRMSKNRLGKDQTYAYNGYYDEYYNYPNYYPSYYPPETPPPETTPPPGTTTPPPDTPIITIPRTDNTTSGTKLPKTGDWQIIALVTATLATGIGAIIAYKKGKDAEGK